MKVGDYCYIKGISRDYGIGKIIQLNSGYSSNGGELIDIQFKHSKHSVPKKDVVSSDSQIDLIEVGDFVTYEKNNMYRNIPTRVVGVFDELTLTTVKVVGDEYLKGVNITSIVTKEQFEAIKYEVK